jgi:putative FmdB family regulatory protein
MPAYDYRCQSCGSVFEKTQRITEPAGAQCPECGGAECTRLITGGTFHLKGSGWYASDYGASKTPAPVKTEGGKSEGTAPATSTDSSTTDSSTKVSSTTDTSTKVSSPVAGTGSDSH